MLHPLNLLSIKNYYKVNLCIQCKKLKHVYSYVFICAPKISIATYGCNLIFNIVLVSSKTDFGMIICVIVKWYVVQRPVTIIKTHVLTTRRTTSHDLVLKVTRIPLLHFVLNSCSLALMNQFNQAFKLMRKIWLFFNRFRISGQQLVEIQCLTVKNKFKMFQCK